MTNLSVFRQQLLERQSEVLGHIKSQLDETGASRRESELREVMDTKDGSFKEAMSTVRQAGLLREAEELEDIRGALARIEQGHYGVCVDCEEDIPEARLKAWPTAKRCRPCQEVREAQKARNR